MPSNFRAPLISYGTEGCFGFYELNLQELIAYGELTSALQHFKELGNGIIFLNQLELTIARNAATRFVSAAPLLGIRPQLHEREKLGREQVGARATSSVCSLLTFPVLCVLCCSHCSR
jgi:hypothetical protein